MIFSAERIMFLGAHPDDIELGCGALLHNIAPHVDVRCITLSDNSKNPELSHILEEHLASLESLGVLREQISVCQFETRKFPQQRQEILEYIFQQRQVFKPDLVFVHTKSDIHQDHNVVTEEALRAMRGTTVLGYDVVRSSYGFFPHFLVAVNEEDVQAKINALAHYKTYSGKYYFDPSLLQATLVRHGALAEKPFAEGFDILRVVGNFQVNR